MKIIIYAEKPTKLKDIIIDYVKMKIINSRLGN